MSEKRWPDPMNPVEHQEFAALCTMNFLTIDALFGCKVATYEGVRMTTPNLGLTIPGQADMGWAHDLAENFLIIDRAVGGLDRMIKERLK